MKTSININLFGTVYAIDEDAHQLLKQYLDNMKSYFCKQEGGDEIADDIEHRVAEHFWELKQHGNESITLEQVTDIIQKIGNPEQMDEQTETNEGASTEAPQTDAPADEKATSGQTDAQPNGPSTPNSKGDQLKSWFSQRRFYRDGSDKLIGGVISGATKYFGGNDPLVWRIAFVLLALLLLDFDCFLYLLILYILFWLIAPEAKTAEERLRMQGKAVNPENIKAEVLDNQQNASTTPAQSTQARGCLSSLVTVIAVLMKVFLIFLAVVMLFSIFIPLLMALIFVAFNFAMLGDVVGMNPEMSQFMTDERGMLCAGIIAALLIFALPLYGLYRLFRSNKRMTTTNIIVLVLLWIASLSVGSYATYKLITKAQELNLSPSDWGVDIDGDNESNVENHNNGTIDFNALKMTGVGKVIYTQGDSCSFRAVGNSKLVMNTNIEVVDNKLVISLPDNVKMGHNHNFTVYVTSPKLYNIELEGVGSIELPDTVVMDSCMNISLKGVGKIESNYITCPKICARQEGVGKTEIKVKTDSLFVNCEGVGKMEIKGTAHYYQKEVAELVSKLEDDGLKVDSL